MKVVIEKWGEGASVPIPAAVMQAAHLHLDQEVDIREEDGAVIIEPVRHEPYDLALLLDGITEDNLHGELPTSDPVGQEIW